MRAWALAAVLVACGGRADAPLVGAPVAVDALPTVDLSPEAAAATLWPRGLRHVFVSPTEAEAGAVRVIVPALLDAATTGRIPDDADDRARSVGLALERWRVGGRVLLVLREPEGRRRGAGAYLVAEGPPEAGDGWTLLQTPHAWSDQDTERIGARWFLDRPDGPRALFTSSVRRDADAEGGRGSREGPADACHDARHLLAVATDAAVRARPGATVVQLHGFAFDGEDDPPPGTLAVVGSGTDTSPDVVVAVRDALAERLGGGVVLASDVGVLEATTNVEARALREVSGARFVHVELSDAARDRLVAEPTAAAALGDAVGAALRR